MSLDHITQSLIELVGIPSTSGHEEHVAPTWSNGLPASA